MTVMVRIVNALEGLEMDVSAFIWLEFGPIYRMGYVWHSSFDAKKFLSPYVKLSLLRAAAPFRCYGAVLLAMQWDLLT